MFGHLPAIPPRAIRTGSWLARKALTRAIRPQLSVAVLLAAVLSLLPIAADAAKIHRLHLPYPQLDWPLEMTGARYAPVAGSDMAGGTQDDHLQAFKASRASCRAPPAQRTPPADPKALGISLRHPCRVAQTTEIS